jgi:hypothetical protein
VNGKIKAGLAVAAIGSLAVAALLVAKSRSQPAVTVTLRISVTPGDQLDFVAGQANSARFKYMIGKISGVKPFLAQKLSIKPVPNSPLLEAKVGVPTKEEAQRYVAEFANTLQGLCEGRAKVVLAEQSIR